MSAVTTDETPRAVPAGDGRASSLTGTGTLLRLVVRRERLRLPIWIVATALVTMGSAASFATLYPSAQERELAGLAVDNAATVALVGRRYGETYDIGIMIGHQFAILLAIVAALMSILTVVRHTRAEEENGLAELVSANVVGRHARTTAAVLAVAGANLLLGVVLAGAVMVTDDATVTWSGAWALGAATTASGLVFTAVTVVTAQFSQSGRGASGLASLVLGASFAWRAVCDVADSSLIWLSPLAWAQRVEPFGTDAWGPVLLAVVASGALLAIGYVLSNRRDLGGALRAQRPGPAHASASLSGAAGLLWRLHRGTLLGWSIGLALVGLTYGSVLDQSGDFLADSGIESILPDGSGGDAVTLFASMIISIGAMLSTIPAAQAVLRLRTEERALRASTVLVASLSRWRWGLTHLGWALASAIIALLSFALGLGGGALAGESDLAFVGEVVMATLGYLPAVLVLVGLASALTGLAPRSSSLVWLLLGLAIFVQYFGALLDLPGWVMDLSPFQHVAFAPAETIRAAPLATLSIVAVVLAAAGCLGLRRRDVEV